MILAFALWLTAAQLEPLPDAAVQPDASVQPADDGQADEPDWATRDDVDELKEKLQALQAQLDATRDRQDFLARFAVRFAGYLDFGFFWVQGDGSGVRPDVQHLAAPELRGQILGSWVLAGDPLSTSINSRGDVADVGQSRAVRFDPVHAGGHPSFMVNSLNLALGVVVTDALSVNASVDFLPRDRDVSLTSALGDFIDVKLAYLRYQLVAQSIALDVELGKIDSLLGVEYRTQDAPDRITVTPSLLCRYTCGRPVGVRGLARLGAERRLELALALTNGTHQADYFTFTNETDVNRWKTVAARIGYRLPLADGLELNLNGALGPQDRQPDDGVLQWHLGAAALLEAGDFTVMAEYVEGAATGKASVTSRGERQCDEAACLRYRGAYGLLAWRATKYLTPYIRGDFRSSRHRYGDQFAYVSDGVRGTLGLKVTIGTHVVLKAEYTLNHELGPVSFPDDVFTSSLVVRY
jgi:hypothetical protein